MADKNAVRMVVTKQVTESVIVLLTDDELTEIKNSEGQMDTESYMELVTSNLAFVTNEDKDEEIQEVELEEVETEEE